MRIETIPSLALVVCLNSLQRLSASVRVEQTSKVIQISTQVKTKRVQTRKHEWQRVLSPGKFSVNSLNRTKDLTGQQPSAWELEKQT